MKTIIKKLQSMFRTGRSTTQLTDDRAFWRNAWFWTGVQATITVMTWILLIVAWLKVR